MTAASPYTLRQRAGEPAPPSAAERRGGLRREDVARIIAERHFTLAFQPVVCLSDRRAVAHEALLRPRPPDGLATLPARVFVDIAAGWGLAVPLDLAVLGAALDAWARSGCTPVSVNVTGGSLCDPDFIAAALARIGGEGAAVLLEVTAAAAIPDLAAFAAGMLALQDAGVRLCMDDLGPDPATLACLQAARFDQVKLDGAILRAACAGPRGRKLLAALLALARAAGADAVAKLIETLPQAWLAQELGVRYGQGWLFGAPGALR